jgi:hypothetical protein
MGWQLGALVVSASIFMHLNRWWCMRCVRRCMQALQACAGRQCSPGSTCDVTWELVNVWHQLCLLCSCCCPTHAPAESYSQASMVALVGADH